MAKQTPIVKKRAELLQKRSWHITEENGNERDLTFAQLCTYFGLKYHCMYNRVVNRGIDVLEALEECRNDPSCWGATYTDGHIARGVFDDKKPQKPIRRG